MLQSKLAEENPGDGESLRQRDAQLQQLRERWDVLVRNMEQKSSEVGILEMNNILLIIMITYFAQFCGFALLHVFKNVFHSAHINFLHLMWSLGPVCRQTFALRRFLLRLLLKESNTFYDLPRAHLKTIYDVLSKWAYYNNYFYLFIYLFAYLLIYLPTIYLLFIYYDIVC